ncbi:MAG TPA: RNA polymerase sigma factor [Balneolaceae bacterium]|nr:RNA polymerase sigma factor [Balneolaceae bacterium]
MSVLHLKKTKPQKLPDSTVVKRVLNGEKELFEILIRRYNQTLFRVIRSYLKDEEQVKDIMQDSYIKAYQKLHQFRFEAKFSTWLIQIGINEALQELRRKKRQHIVNIDDQKETDLGNNKMTPEKRTIQHENRKAIERAVDKLPEKYRIVYMMRAFEGIKNGEIAECLSISKGNVKVRFHRAKKMLKETLYEFSSNTTAFEFGNEQCDQIVERVMSKI